MKLSWDDIQANAISFSKRWEDAHDEMSEAQSFVRAFLAIFGVQDPLAVGRFEKRTPHGHSIIADEPDGEQSENSHKGTGQHQQGTRGRGFHDQPGADALRNGRRFGRMDYFWPKQIAIEMKSRGKDLGEAYRQLKDYVIHLPSDDMPELLMVSDFEKIALYNRTTADGVSFKTKDLHQNIRRFARIAGFETTRRIVEQLEVNVQAAEKMALLHDTLKKRGYEGHDLEVYLVRLLFCLFADSTGIFPRQTFLNYIQNSKDDGSDLSERIFKLFEILNMPDDTRDKKTLLSPNIKQFRYINGGLFKDPLLSAQFDPKMRGILIDCCYFDWSSISPAIFGAMFQGIMDREQRREIGAHYTSEENILKLINPLFIDELWKEFNAIKTELKALDKFHAKIASLKILDPACGCGNFLIIAYRELRLLELEILKIKVSSGQKRLAFAVASLLKVNVGQFYGIECEAFPCQIAQTGLWLMDHLMNMRVSTEFGQHYVRLPLTTSATIVHGNALRIDWESVVSKDELSYILGNPPFVGKKEQSKEQKAELFETFGNQKGIGNLDYVTAWYKKAADMMDSTTIRTAFVSTNSITQGEQAPVLWKALHNAVKIDFAHRTFKWSNEAKGKAAVHCVIVGFSKYSVKNVRIIFDGGDKTIAANINPYLIDGPDVLIESRTKPLCRVPEMAYGSMPIDDGALILSEEEMDALNKAELKSQKFVRRYVGGDELLNNTVRYCLWLKGFAPSELKMSKFITERIKQCRQFREKSNRLQTKTLADTPQLFGEIRQPETDMLVIPKVSSENRKYLPIGFLPPEIIVNGSALIVPTATLYHFGILTSSVHMAWMR
ncbi:MAG: hypothetical protein LBH03_06500, partial [Holophagales bacterium]|nr:hypothetical protein [Holophagales bacterium]